MSEPQADQPQATPSTPARWIQIHHQKSNFFRVAHADGVWCSVNAHHQIHLAFYSERFPIPTSVFFGLDEKGLVIGEDLSKRQGKEDWVREMEVDVVLSIPAAKGVLDALARFIKIAEESA